MCGKPSPCCCQSKLNDAENSQPSKRATRPQTASDNSDFMQNFHESKLCDIPATGSRKKDAFASMRPDVGKVKDYNLEQNKTKLERTGPDGLQKLRIKETKVTYRPKTPPAKEVKEVDPEFIQYTTGRGPCCEFIDDIWREKIEVVQEQYRKRLPKLIKARKLKDKLAMEKDHQKLLDRVGPDWFQELSPQQMQTVDNLKNCIIKDIKRKCICNTQDNISALGIMMRPNHKHIEQALSQCCQCPVEFLLILYQLMNKKRTEYSLNDRLLLSGVVHLTMKETLKELHVRIPSPPPPALEPTPVPVKEKKKRYKSPYLIPFTFKPEPRKYTGVYVNKHVQHPESPYFSYKNELPPKKYLLLASCAGGEEKKPADPEASPIIPNIRQEGITDELEEELLSELRLAQQIYNKISKRECIPYLNKPTIYIPCDYGIEANFAMSSSPSKTSKKPPTTSSSENQTNVSISVSVRVTTDFDECYRLVRKVCECDLQFDQVKVPKGSRGRSDTDDYEGDACGEVKKVETPCAALEDCCMQTEGIPSNAAIAKNQKDCATECKCTDEVQCEDKTGQEELIEVGRRESAECKCKMENEKYLEKNFCQCDRCKADREEIELQKKTNQKYICTCLEQYYEKVRKFEEIKKRFDAQRDLVTLKKQYVIGGVTHSPEGEPVYILTGTKPEYECPCAEGYEDRTREEQRLENMPKNLPTVPKYVIGGVQERQDGNVYVIGGSKAAPECACMKTYNEYMKKHSACLEAYDVYLRKTQMDIDEYLKELESDARYDVERVKDDVASQQSMVQDCLLKCCTTESGTVDKNLAIEDLDCVLHCCTDEGGVAGQDQVDTDCLLRCCTDKQTATIGTETIKAANDDCKLQCCPNDDLEVETNLKLRLEINMDDIKKKEVCSCQKQGAICDCGGDGAGAKKKEDKPDAIANALHRFVILEKIPSKQDEGEKIVKNALEVLAKDGFPLAKLPECHRLPHFKLWMQMRYGKFWTQADRFPYLMSSLGSWRHTDLCAMKVWAPKIKPELQEREFTWANYKTVKKLVADMEGNYYRKLRQARVYDSREFYPSTFSYEFPTDAFRDFYFSYTSAKEDDCIAWKPWYPHEMRLDMRSSKPC